MTATAVGRTDFLTAPSQALLEVAERMGLPADRAHHLLWGVDTGRFNPAVDGGPVRVKSAARPGAVVYPWP